MFVFQVLLGGLTTCDAVNILCDSPSPPSFQIVVDFGDGSGGSMWTPDQPNNIFQHIFSIPGLYGVAVSSK